MQNFPDVLIFSYNVLSQKLYFAYSFTVLPHIFKCFFFFFQKEQRSLKFKQKINSYQVNQIVKEQTSFPTIVCHSSLRQSTIFAYINLLITYLVSITLFNIPLWWNETRTYGKIILKSTLSRWFVKRNLLHLLLNFWK